MLPSLLGRHDLQGSKICEGEQNLSWKLDVRYGHGECGVLVGCVGFTMDMMHRGCKPLIISSTRFKTRLDAIKLHWNEKKQAGSHWKSRAPDSIRRLRKREEGPAEVCADKKLRITWPVES